MDEIKTRKWGRPKGCLQSVETKARIALGVRAAHVRKVQAQLNKIEVESALNDGGASQ